MKQKNLIQTTLLVTALGQLTGFFHYLCQIIAVKRLPLTALAEMNEALAYFGILSSIGVLFQYTPIFLGISGVLKKRLKLFSFLTGAVFLLIYAFGKWSAFPFHLGFFLLFLPAMWFSMLWMGLFQRSEAYLLFAWIAFWNGFVRVIVSYLSISESGFLVAVAAGPVLFLLLASLFSLEKKVEVTAPSTSKEESLYRRFAFVFLIGFASVFFPMLDFLNVRYFLSKELAGELNRVQLFSKILYFAPVALLQVTLPKYVKIARGEAKLEELGKLRLLEGLGLAACCVILIFFSLFGAEAASRYLGVQGLSSKTIALSCAEMISLYAILCSLQILASLEKIWLCVSIVVASFSGSFLLWALQLRALDDYLLLQLCLNAVLGLLFWMLSSRFIKHRRAEAA